MEREKSSVAIDKVVGVALLREIFEDLEIEQRAGSGQAAAKHRYTGSSMCSMRAPLPLSVALS